MNKNRKLTSAGIVAVSAAVLAGAASTVPSVPTEASALAGAVASMYSVAEPVIETSSSLSGTNLAISNMLEMAQLNVGVRLVDSETTELDADISEEAEPVGEFDNIGIANVNDYVNVRTAPSEEAELAGKLYAKGAAIVLDVEGDWAHIQSGKVIGYVHSDYLVIGDEALCLENSAIIARVTADALNVRSTPDNSDNDNVFKSVSEGDAIRVVDMNLDTPDWIKVRIGEREGYVASEFVTCGREYFSVAESREDELNRLAAEKAEAERKKKAAEEAARRKASSSRSSSQSSQARSYVPPTGSDGASVANFGLQFVGNPYRYGGTSLTSGADCSGFVMSVYSNFGVGLPHSSSGLRSVGYGVSASEMQPGDIVCYSGHVGICIGNGQIVHASNRRDGIKVSSAYYRNILAVRRIF